MNSKILTFISVMILTLFASFASFADITYLEGKTVMPLVDQVTPMVSDIDAAMVSTVLISAPLVASPLDASTMVGTVDSRNVRYTLPYSEVRPALATHRQGVNSYGVNLQPSDPVPIHL